MSFEIEPLEPREFLSGSPNLTVSASRLIYNQPINTSGRAQYVTITNTGRRTLALNSYTLGGADGNQFIFSRRRLPSSLAPGASTSLKISFGPTSEGVKVASIQIASNDPDTPLFSVNLRGLGTTGLFAENEPSLQRILDTYQIPVNVGDGDIATGLLDGPHASDEVPMQLLKKAGPGFVRMTPIAMFTWNNDPEATLGWYRAKGPQVLKPAFTVPDGYSQTLKPIFSGSTRFDPGSVNFGLYANFPFEPHANAFSENALNTWDHTADNKHKFRFYPYKTASGRTVPNVYVVAVEEAFNSDFQDAVMIIENVTPYNAVTAPTGLGVAGLTPTSVDLHWTDNNAYETNYVIERSTRKTGTYSVIATLAAGSTSYHDGSLLHDTLYFYRVRAVNSTGTSAPSNLAAARTSP